ncbi:hypothetical protein WJX77_010470 [Trebouxia sp. C0004]
MVDDALAEINAIRETFYDTFKDEQEFVAYFQKHWGHKFEEWVRGFCEVNHTRQDTTGACEGFHSAIKGDELAMKTRLQGRRVDWLLWLLWNEVDLRFQRKQAYKAAGFVTNRRQEQAVASAVVAAQRIPDNFVKLLDSSGQLAEVTSMQDSSVKYEVKAAGIAAASCTCPNAQLHFICNPQLEQQLISQLRQVKGSIAKIKASNLVGTAHPMAVLDKVSKMAFSFGTPSGSAFGASSGGFGQSSTPAFGAVSTPVFAHSNAPFGASSGAFSFAAASTSAFGGQSGAFNFASASTPTFGASAPAFGASVPAFGASAPSFGQLAPFAQQPQQQQQQQHQQQQQNQLSTKNGQPISDSTQWDDINDPSKQVLLGLEKQIMEYRHQKQQVNACQRLQESQEAKEDMEAEHHSLAQILSVLANVVKSDSDSIDSFRERVMQLLHHTDVAVMTAQRAETWRQLSKKLQHGQPIDPAERDRLLRLPITLPSNYLRTAVQQFQETLQQYEQLVRSLERVVQPEEGLHPALRSQEGHEPPLKIILQNLYRYLMAVTANLDKLHEGVADARQAFLDKRKQGGDYSNPFEEADQRELQQRKAERARAQAALMHSTQAAPQPQAPAAPASAPQLTFGSTPAPTSGPGTGGLFSTAAAFGQSAGGSSLFGAPAQSAPATGTLFGGSQPASAGLFGAPQSAAFTGSVFGSPQSAPAAGGLLGAAPGATPAFGTQQPASPFGGTAQSAAAFGQPFGGGGFGQQNAFNRQPTQPVNTRKTKSGRK